MLQFLLRIVGSKLRRGGNGARASREKIENKRGGRSYPRCEMGRSFPFDFWKNTENSPIEVTRFQKVLSVKLKTVKKQTATWFQKVLNATRRLMKLWQNIKTNKRTSIITTYEYLCNKVRNTFLQVSFLITQIGTLDTFWNRTVELFCTVQQVRANIKTCHPCSEMGLVEQTLHRGMVLQS